VSILNEYSNWEWYGVGWVEETNLDICGIEEPCRQACNLRKRVSSFYMLKSKKMDYFAAARMGDVL
jgi:hypothetical protein